MKRRETKTVDKQEARKAKAKRMYKAKKALGKKSGVVA